MLNILLSQGLKFIENDNVERFNINPADFLIVKNNESLCRYKSYI